MTSVGASEDMLLLRTPPPSHARYSSRLALVRTDSRCVFAPVRARRSAIMFFFPILVDLAVLISPHSAGLPGDGDLGDHARLLLERLQALLRGGAWAEQGQVDGGHPGEPDDDGNIPDWEVQE